MEESWFAAGGDIEEGGSLPGGGEVGIDEFVDMLCECLQGEVEINNHKSELVNISVVWRYDH